MQIVWLLAGSIVSGPCLVKPNRVNVPPPLRPGTDRSADRYGGLDEALRLGDRGGERLVDVLEPVAVRHEAGE